MRNNELDGIVRRYEIDVSQLRQEVSQLKQALRERDSDLGEAQARAERTEERAVAAEAAKTIAVVHASEAANIVSAQAEELHKAHSDALKAQARAEAAEAATAAAQSEATSARDNADNARVTAAKAEARASRLSAETAKVNADNYKMQEEIQEIRGKIESLRAQIHEPDAVTGKSKKRSRTVSSHQNESVEGGTEVKDLQVSKPSERDENTKKPEIIRHLCELLSFDCADNITADSLERVLNVASRPRHDQGVQVAEFVDSIAEVEKGPADVTPPKEPQTPGKTRALSRSPLEEAIQGRRTSVRREILNAKIAKKQAEARRVEEERERDRAQRLRDARLARDSRRNSQISGSWPNCEVPKSGQTENKKKQKMHPMRQLKQDEKSPIVAVPESRCHELSQQQDYLRQDEEDFLRSPLIHVSSDTNAFEYCRQRKSLDYVGNSNTQETDPETSQSVKAESILIIEEVPMPTEHVTGVLCGGGDPGGQIDMGNGESHHQEGTGPPVPGKTEKAESGASSLGQLAEFVIGDTTFSANFTGEVVRRRNRRKGENGSRSARRRSLR